jgi:hypothetical protein
VLVCHVRLSFPKIPMLENRPIEGIARLEVTSALLGEQQVHIAITTQILLLLIRLTIYMLLS